MPRITSLFICLKSVFFLYTCIATFYLFQKWYKGWFYNYNFLKRIIYRMLYIFTKKEKRHYNIANQTHRIALWHDTIEVHTY